MQAVAPRVIGAALLLKKKRVLKTNMFSHPQDVCMTYVEHWFFAMGLAGHFALAAIRSTVHAFLPNLFVQSSSDAVRRVARLLAESGCRQ